MTDNRLELLEKRREASIGKQVDNGSLPSGSPMYYYCRSCGVHVVTLPENWWKDPPPPHCEDCKPLIEEGVIDRQDTFKSWEIAHKKETSHG